MNADTTDVLDVQGDLYDKNLFTYCDNNPIVRIDKTGYMWEVTIADVGTMTFSSGISKSAIGGSIVAALGAITPVGWIVIGSVAVSAVVVVGVTYAKKEKSKQEVDPYAREGQKKQGRENKNKSRRKSDFQSRNNKRNGKPAEPKHHTHGREHQKYSQSGKKLELMYKRIG